MAKRKKKGGNVKTRTRTKVVTKTRKVYVAAKRKARRARRELGSSVSPTDIVLAVAGAGVGSIGGSVVLAKMPAAVPNIAKNGILAALGGFVAYKGLKKRNKLFLGLGLGAGAAAATNIISGLISGESLSGCAANRTLAAPYATLAGAANRTLSAPYATMAAPIDAEEM